MKAITWAIFMLLIVGLLLATVVPTANASEIRPGDVENSEIWELIQRLRLHSEREGEEDAELSEDLASAANELEHFLILKASAKEQSRYPNIELSQEQKELLAKIVWLEGRGESFEGQQAIAEVVLNRMVAENFPDTLNGVLYAEGQFSSIGLIGTAKPEETQYEAVEAALNGPYVLPIDVVFFAQFAVNKNIWGEIGGHTFCYQWGWKNEVKAK